MIVVPDGAGFNIKALSPCRRLGFSLRDKCRNAAIAQDKTQNLIRAGKIHCLKDIASCSGKHGKLPEDRSIAIIHIDPVSGDKIHRGAHAAFTTFQIQIVDFQRRTIDDSYGYLRSGRKRRQEEEEKYHQTSG